MTISDPITSSMLWANDANSYVCTQVMPNGINVLANQDLSGDYYDNSTATIQYMIAKGMFIVLILLIV